MTARSLFGRGHRLLGADAARLADRPRGVSRRRRAGRSAGQAARARDPGRRPSGGARPTASPSRSRWPSAAVRASGRDPATLPSVFTSAHGDLAVNDYMCATLATQPTAISPTRFHNSVHNAAAGYWTIATGCHAASSAADRVRRELRRRPARGGDPVRGRRRARCCWSRSTSQAVGALASVTRSVGLLAAALVHRRRRARAAARTAVVRGHARVAVRRRRDGARDRRRRAPLAGNAMADALPFFEALRARPERRARPAAVAHAGACA